MLRLVMEGQHPVDLAAEDQILRHGDGWHAAVVMRYDERYSGALGSFQHGPRLQCVVDDGLFQQDVLSGFSRRHGDRQVGVVRGADIHRVDVIPCYKLLPTGINRFSAETVKGSKAGFVGSAGGLYHWHFG
jgi:hypothetical protein